MLETMSKIRRRTPCQRALAADPKGQKLKPNALVDADARDQSTAKSHKGGENSVELVMQTVHENEA